MKKFVIIVIILLSYLGCKEELPSQDISSTTSKIISKEDKTQDSKNTTIVNNNEELIEGISLIQKSTDEKDQGLVLAVIIDEQYDNASLRAKSYKIKDQFAINGKFLHIIYYLNKDSFDKDVPWAEANFVPDLNLIVFGLPKESKAENKDKLKKIVW